MSVFALKLIAVVCMLIDHIGARASIAFLRMPGRLAFPIYAYLIGNGFRYTHSRGRYLARLCLLALVSQGIYTLCLFDTVRIVQLNIFVSLALGLGWLWALEAYPNRQVWISLVFLALCAALESLVGLDYGVYGVLLIVAFYLCDGVQPRQRAATVVCFVALYYLPFWDRLLRGIPLAGNWYLSVPGILALPLIFCYNRTPGLERLGPRAKKGVQLAFYLFYPVHLLLLWALIPK